MSEPQYPSAGGPNQVVPPPQPVYPPAPPPGPSWGQPTPVYPPAPPPAPGPSWGQPQPAQTGWVMPAQVAQEPGRVSFLVIVAALFLLLAGVLTVLVGAGLFLGGNVLGQLDTTDTGSGVFGAIGGFVAGVAVVVIVWALLEILGAFGMLFRRGWGRAIGFIVGIIGAIFTGLALLASLSSLGSLDSAGGSTGAGVAVILVVFLGYVLTVYATIRGGGHFRRA